MKGAAGTQAAVTFILIENLFLMTVPH
ncbi:hypothetical protein B14911_15975 [Bacillus sp. NRRL B-14911]|nr:hypothetical protein B14911_15975 [Bacillus sp. NRRL B-14911]